MLYVQRLARNFYKSDESWNPDYGWLKVTESYPIEFVSHVSYSLLLIGIHVIASFTRLATIPTKRPDRPVSPTTLVFNAPGGGVPWADLRESLHGPPCTKSCKNIGEKFNRLSRLHERHRQTTHRRETTDTIAVPLAEHNVVTFG